MDNVAVINFLINKKNKTILKTILIIQDHGILVQQFVNQVSNSIAVLFFIY